ncbi:hypothetical protein ACQP3J_28210, partial [Escherichia coli]
GFWQSRRNRYDLLVTSLGVVWVVLHFALLVGTSLNFILADSSVFLSSAVSIQASVLACPWVSDRICPQLQQLREP